MWLISLFIIENNFNISKFYETSNTDLRAFFFSSSLRTAFLGDLLSTLPLCSVNVPMSISLSVFFHGNPIKLFYNIFRASPRNIEANDRTLCIFYNSNYIYK